MQSALDIYQMLTESNTDLRQPVGLESQLLKESSMDNEVGMSMLQLLTVRLLSTCLIPTTVVILTSSDLHNFGINRTCEETLLHVCLSPK